MIVTGVAASYNDLITNYDLQLCCLGLRARPLRLTAAPTAAPPSTPP
jgi:hypothetical protein